MQSFSCPSYKKDDLLGTFNFLLRLLISLAYLYTTLMTVVFVLRERKSKQEGHLRLCGANCFNLYASWFIRSLAIYTLLSLVLTSLVKIQFPSNTNSNPKFMLENTPFLVVLMTLSFYSVQLTLFTLVITKFFQKSNFIRVAHLPKPSL
jgi:hypothetical protein